LGEGEGNDQKQEKDTRKSEIEEKPKEQERYVTSTKA
jgi:hypothetical protein